MYQMDSEKVYATLRRQGFSTREIDRLSKLRRVFAKKSELDQEVPDIRHLEFVRWLVETGRLTDQLT